MQLVELKSGETYNGHMVQCDSWMNVHLREVICTSKVSYANKYRPFRQAHMIHAWHTGWRQVLEYARGIYQRKHHQVFESPR